ncbi:hypothetical protein COHA_003138 [Chlorella ohadii]|uniref:Chlorophyllase n=1 Tax=Chlorella ohadii TaxID=2649997 RepID=A0AAD5H893_9CHLO|nr:hypothetical protein COHA_003138 [Chlorella ohadii]
MRRAALIMALACLLARAAGAPNFSLPGPCSASPWKPQFTVPDDLRTGGLPRTLSLLVTTPSCPADASLPFGSPAPVLFFFNGFMNKASWYQRIVQQIASWGWVVVQYDTPSLPPVTIAAEVQLFPALAEWVAAQANDTASPLYGVADPQRLATSGHSRGGKLASLVFTTYPELVSATYLVDPVDLSRFSPESADNPSAARALRESGQAIGMAAAGITGSCNPVDGSSAFMWAAAGNGSWRGLEPGAAHATFADGGCVVNAGADLLCGRGKDSRAQAAALTSTQALAWFWQQLVGEQQTVPPSESPMPAFARWVAAQQVAGTLEFEVKGEEGAALWTAEAARAAKEGGLEAPPALPTAAEEEAACAVAGGR